MTVRKLNIAGETELTWTGKLREHTADWLQIEAHFDLYPYIDLGYAVFERGDRFVEWFFTKNWYSIYQMQLKRLILMRKIILCKIIRQLTKIEIYQYFSTTDNKN